MVLGDGNIVHTGSRRESKVHAIQLDDQYRAKRTTVVTSGVTMPVGVAFRDGILHVAAVDRILRFDGIGKRPHNPQAPVTVRYDLLSERHHGWKIIPFAPDGRLYVPVGAPCSICKRDPERFAVIAKMKPDGSHFRTFARVVRNDVGFDWQPGTGAPSLPDKGRDLQGSTCSNTARRVTAAKSSSPCSPEAPYSCLPRSLSIALTPSRANAPQAMPNSMSSASATTPPITPDASAA